MIRLRDEKLQYDITEKQQKYQLYHQVKSNILQGKKYYLLVKKE